MILPEPFDLIILGAGIAGLSVADAAIQQGKRCLIVDSKDPGGGASGAPMMLINPATGRRAKKAWKAEESFGAISGLLNRVQEQSKHSFFDQNGVLRPALTEKIADDFKMSDSKYNWDHGWLEWLDKPEFSSRFPFIGNHYGGLVVSNAITLLGDTFLKSFSRYLKKNNLHTSYGHEPEIFRKKDDWFVDTGCGVEYTSKIVVDATGWNQTKNGYWNFLPLHPVKGQLATYFFEENPKLPHSISSLGYMAVTKIKPKQITVGSTYEHDFKDLKTTPQASAYLRKKFENTLPGFLEKSIYSRQWASLRVSLPDKMPVIGPHPEFKGLYIIGAFGSKGLLLSTLVAGQLVRQIFEDVHPNKKISISRFLQP